MKIVLGSTSSTKIQILREVLNDFVKEEIEVLGVEVNSEITDQPLDEVTTIQGSMNRSANALKNNTDASFSIGMEGGLDLVSKRGYFLICAATITDKDGHVAIGVSSKLQLPREVSDAIMGGDQFGEVIRQYTEDHKGDLNIKLVLDELISRKVSFTEAIRNAYLAYLNWKHY